MKDTAFLTAAYHGDMETVVLLFLLASLDKDRSLQDSLRNLLGFYKENRDLLAMIAGAAGTNAAQAASPQTPSPAAEQKKSRPLEEDGAVNVLEQYLKRCAV